MAFTLPTFNLSVNIFTGPFLGHGPPRLVVMGNLAWSRRVNTSQILGSSFPGFDFQQVMTLLLPSGTDIRDPAQLAAGQYDFVEVPAGSGRIYGVFIVDDIGKGFPNEHRAASLLKIYQQMNPVLFPGLVWPTPMP